ncbi:MAG TPA: hypothetical protein VFR17_14070 [Mycobacterium sp.]|nr:hypothetical protein [Mycobacterium sp.]
MGAKIRLVARRCVTTLAAATLSVTAPLPQYASADPPPGFPNLLLFAPVPAEGYFVHLQAGSSRLLNFSTPDNVVCSFYAGEDLVPGQSQGINCDGTMPGMINAPFSGGGGGRLHPGECVLGAVRSAGPAYRLERNTYGDCDGRPPKLPNTGKLLETGQKVSYQNVTCAVGVEHLLACLDTTSGEHGFVLQPAGSTAF